MEVRNHLNVLTIDIVPKVPQSLAYVQMEHMPHQENDLKVKKSIVFHVNQADIVLMV